MAAMQRRDDVQHDEDLPRPRARTGARRSGCRRSRRAAGRSPVRRRAEQDQNARAGRTRSGCWRGSRRTRSGPERAQQLGRRRRRSGPSAICQTLARPRTTRPMPRVMISGWTRNTPTPMPVSEPGERRRRRARRGWPRRGPGPPTSVATRNPAIDATAPTDRSMPPVSIVSVWQPARIASGTAARTIVAGPARR